MKKLINGVIVLLVVFSLIVETRFFVTGKILISNLPESILGRLNYYYSYFTILSNITIGVSSLILFFYPLYDKKWFRVLRLDGLLCIMITCVVYNTVLRQGHNTQGVLEITNECLHVIVPFLSIGYWFIFGPRKQLDKNTLFIAIIPPLVYILYIFVRGGITGLYPYFFLDAGKLGIIPALRNTGVVVIVFFLFEFVFYFSDKKLSRN